MSLLERRRQLEDLVAYATEARAGDGRLVLVAGEAGVGKSTLVEAAEAAVRQSHTEGRWVWGRCDGQFTPRPPLPSPRSVSTSAVDSWVRGASVRAASATVPLSCSAISTIGLSGRGVNWPSHRS